MGLCHRRSGRARGATRGRRTWEGAAQRSRRVSDSGGTLQAGASVARREKSGQTRSATALCSRRTASGGSGEPARLYCPSCDPTTHARVSPRDRRDTRPHPHHLLRHPDLRRPAVQGPAEVDGAHAGAGAVRPGRQADAPLRRLQARRHRGLHAAARLGPGRRHARSSSGSSASAATRSTSTTATSTSTAPRSSSRTCTRPPTATPQPTTVQGDQHSWVVPQGDLFLMGDHRANSEDSRTFGTVPVSQVIGRAWLRYWPLDTFGILPTPTYPELAPTSP